MEDHKETLSRIISTPKLCCQLRRLFEYNPREMNVSTLEQWKTGRREDSFKRDLDVKPTDSACRLVVAAGGEWRNRKITPSCVLWEGCVCVVLLLFACMFNW